MINLLRFGTYQEESCSILKAMKHLFTQYALIRRRTFRYLVNSPEIGNCDTYSRHDVWLHLMGRLKLGFMIIRVLKLIMMLLDAGVLQCFTVLMELDYFHVELVKMQNLSWLSGMRVKGQ